MVAQDKSLALVEHGRAPVEHGSAVLDDALLEKLGYKPELKRGFSPFQIFGFSFSMIGVVPAMISVLFFAIPNGGAVSILWGWALGSIVITIIGLAMAELASAAPTAGGLYYWTYSFSSPRTRVFLAWTCGYANTIGMVSSVASVDWGCAVQIMAAASIGSDTVFAPTLQQTFGVYCAILLLHGFIASLGTGVLARLQHVYMVLNAVLILAVLISVPAATPSEFKNTAKYALTSFVNLNGWPDGFAFILGLLYPLWAICCFDSPVHMSEEVSNADIAVPWAIVLSSSLSALVGLAINFVIVFFMGTDMESIVSSPIGQPMATILFNSLGQKGTLAVWSLIVIVQFWMGAATLIAASRQMFAFARDGALPLSSVLYRVNSHTGTPVNTVWASVFCAFALGCIALAGLTAQTAIFALVVVSQYFSYGTPIAARVIFANSNGFKPGPFHLGKFSFPIAISAVAIMAFMIVVFLFPAVPNPNAASMNYTIVVFGAVMAFSTIWYFLPRYGGRTWFKGPVTTAIHGEGSSDEKTDRTESLSSTR